MIDVGWLGMEMECARWVGGCMMQGRHDLHVLSVGVHKGKIRPLLLSHSMSRNYIL